MSDIITHLKALKLQGMAECNASQKPDSLLNSLSPENTFIF